MVNLLSHLACVLVIVIGRSNNHEEQEEESQPRQLLDKRNLSPGEKGNSRKHLRHDPVLKLKGGKGEAYTGLQNYEL